MNPLNRLALSCLLLAGGYSALPLMAAPVAAPPAKASDLELGAPAPAFKAGRWVKGTPVQTLRKGQVYVVEFWATWCGPCRMSIPHLTELAKEFQGKVTFIGVDILESGHGGDPTKADGKVNKLVAEMGAQMEYSVCRDTADGVMENTWFNPGKFGGIPACVVVDASGQVAWMGHPLSLDAVLPEVLSSGFDPKVFAAAFAQQEEAQKEIQEALRAQKWTRALERIAAYQPLKHDKTNYKEMFRFQALLHVDAKGAEALFTGWKGQAEQEANSVQIIAFEKGLDKVWYERAIPVLEKLASQKDKAYLKLLATVHFQVGQKEKAVAIQIAYVDWIKAEKAKDPDKTVAYDYMLREARADLAEYQD